MQPQTPTLPSNRQFGLFFALAFFLCAYWSMDSMLTVLACTIAGVGFLLAAFWMPDRLRRLNNGWYQFGLLLGKIVSPLVLGMLFFLLITPLALLTRAIGRDALRLRRGVGVPSYWVKRESADPDPASFRYQF